MKTQAKSKTLPCFILGSPMLDVAERLGPRMTVQARPPVGALMARKEAITAAVAWTRKEGGKPALMCHEKRDRLTNRVRRRWWPGRVVERK